MKETKRKKLSGVRKAAADWVRKTYALSPSIARDMTAEELWERDVKLLEIERGFRAGVRWAKRNMGQTPPLTRRQKGG